MTVKEIEGVSEKDRVIIPLNEDTELLSRGGYGVVCEESSSLVLAHYEALYLLSENRITLRDRKSGEPLSLESLLHRLSVSNSMIWTKYLIYRDLRSRGYVVREGIGWGINFRLYDRGTYGKKAAKFIVLAICEGTPMPITQLKKALMLTQNIKKELIIAVIDRQGVIVYYSLKKLNV
jgi:tRNA-intron endonuclease